MFNDSKRPVARKMPWNELRMMLANSDAASKAAPFLQASDAIAKRLKAEAYVYHLRYPFGHPVLSDSGICLPDRDSNGHNLQSMTSVPVSLVLRNHVEVYIPGIFHHPPIREWNKGYPCDRPQTLRMIGPGELFGTFEAAERVFSTGKRAGKQWHACAGSRSALLVYPLKTLDSKVARTFNKSWKSVGPLSEWSWNLIEILGRDSEWWAEVVVFPKQWEESHLDWTWRHEVLKAAWSQIQTGYETQMLWQHLQTEVDENRRLRDIARIMEIDRTLLLAVMYSCSTATRDMSTAYVSADRMDGAEGFGPFTDVLNRFVEVCSDHQRRSGQRGPVAPTIFLPKVLKVSESGVLPFRRSPTFSGLTVDERVDSRIVKRLALAMRSSDFREVLAELVPSVNWDNTKLVVAHNAKPKSKSKYEDGGDNDTPLLSDFVLTTNLLENDSRLTPTRPGRLDIMNALFSPSILVCRGARHA